jgi:predicted nucleotidyltransferase
MDRGPLTVEALRAAFEELDRTLDRPVSLVVGGGTAMMLAHGMPVRTADVDAYPRDASFEEIQPAIRTVARRLGLAPDWVNPHYETFAHVLPSDYGRRLRSVFTGARLAVEALGVEDLLVMKCFAGREKDVGHARALLRRRPDLALVERRLQELAERRVKGAQEALDFFDDLAGDGA